MAGLTSWARLWALPLCVVLSPSVALAQAELDGTFIDYLGVGPSGTMVNAAGHSMRYRESAADPYSCDVWFPDDSISTFSIEGFGVGLGGAFAGTNDGVGLAGIATTDTSAVAGRVIHWAGRIDAGLLGGGHLRISHDWAFQADDRVVVETITISNPSGVTIQDVYYLTHGDPDHGDCSIGSSNDTMNDVVRQQPTNGSALAIAGTIAGSSRSVFFGMGTFDALGRVRFSSGLEDRNASVAWHNPSDPNGARGDRGLSVSFHPADLAPGASVTFHVFYVWGSSASEVTDRFDSAACLLAADGAACSVGGASGTCHARACCTGCWNGSACQAGSALSACGAGGAACTSCTDTNVCTDDACTAGACVRTNNTASCDDGAFCTSGDRCAAGTCGAGVAMACDDGLSCTGNTCDEAMDRCLNPVAAGCTIDGACRAGGAVNAADACLSCVPATSTTAWTYFASPTCDGDGDGVPDTVERPGGVERDTDGDLMPDHRDADDDGDGLPTMAERPGAADVDSDVDGTPDYRDGDDDGDGVLTSVERPAGTDQDTDGDSFPDHRDADDDGDGLPTMMERPAGTDLDSDVDGTPDYRDADDDADGLLTSIERADEAALGGDVDGDSFPAYLDTDSDADGALDTTEGRTDGDGDGAPDYLDADTTPGDMDGDGVSDADECPSTPCRDTDGDGTADRNDADDDGDGIPTRTELRDETARGGDVDHDGTPAYLDTNSDGDARLDRDEGVADTDGDGVRDYLDPMVEGPDGGVADGGTSGSDAGASTGDGGVVRDGGLADAGPGSAVDAGRPIGGLAGGALCTAAPGTRSGSLFVGLALAVVALVTRRTARKGGAR